MWDWIALVALPLVGMSAVAGSRLRSRLGSGLKRTAESPGPNVGGQSCIPLWPNTWLAVKSRSLLAVQSALSLHNAKPCSWLEGLTNADKLFISPPVKGWIVITGTGLPEPSNDVDACFRFVMDLSRKLGQVQLFSANRTSHHHAWVKAEEGHVVRAFAWAGLTIWHQGTPTAGEKDLGLTWYDYGAQSADLSAVGEAAERNVQRVRLLAARWGLDPLRVQEHFLREEQGIAGKPANRY